MTIMHRTTLAVGLRSERKVGREVMRTAGEVLRQRIWLPKIVYELIPYFYLASGLATFWAVIHISDWYWYIPICLLSSVACMHMAYRVFVLRHRARKTYP